MHLTPQNILAVVSLFESLGREGGTQEKSDSEAGGLAWVDPHVLVSELKQRISAEDPGDGFNRSSLYWVLGKRRDAALVPFFRERLRVELDRDDMEAVHQILIALQDLGEPGDPDRRSYSVFDHEMNREEAKGYLKEEWVAGEEHDESRIPDDR